MRNKVCSTRKAQMSAAMKFVITVVVIIGLFIAGYAVWKVVRGILGGGA